MGKKRNRQQKADSSNSSTESQTTNMSDNTNPEGQDNATEQNAAASASLGDDGTSGSAAAVSSETGVSDTSGAAGSQLEEVSDGGVNNESVSNAAGGEATRASAAVVAASATAGASGSVADSASAPAVQQAAPAADVRNDAPAGASAVAGPAVPVVVDAAVSQPADPLQVLFEQALAKVGSSGQVLLQRLQQYVQDMGAGKIISEEAGARNQVALYRTLTGIINNLDGSDFQTAFGLVCKAFLLGKDGAFHETHVFRYTEHVALPPEDRKTFVRLLNLIKVMADPRGRSVAKRQINVQQSFGQAISEAGKQRVQAYFNL